MSASVVIERSWKAPIALVWELWSTPEGMSSWYGPEGFQVTVEHMEVEVGGRFHYVMAAVDPATVARMKAAGRPSSWPVRATYFAVEEAIRLGWEAPFSPTDSLKTEVVFQVDGDQVSATLTLSAAAESMLGGASMGWRMALDKLERRLAA